MRRINVDLTKESEDGLISIHVARIGDLELGSVVLLVDAFRDDVEAKAIYCSTTGVWGYFDFKSIEEIEKVEKLQDEFWKSQQSFEE